MLLTNTLCAHYRPEGLCLGGKWCTGHNKRLERRLHNAPGMLTGFQRFKKSILIEADFTIRLQYVNFYSMSYI